MTKAERFQVYNKYGGHCAYCGKKDRVQGYAGRPYYTATDVKGT
jgi:hypothetical protein